jgi:hypothetical protein
MKDDTPISNLHAPISLNSKLSSDPDLSFREAKWRRYEANQASVQNIVNTRASAYARLTGSAIRVRRTYGKKILVNDEKAVAIRSEFALREFGWNEYINNKNFRLRADSVANYDQGRAVLYQIANLNAIAVSLRIDLSDRTRTQLEAYKTLATDSYIGKVSSAVHYDKNLSVLGTRCADSETCEWSGLRGAMPTLEFSVGVGSQRKFNNVLDIGRISTADSHSSIEFGAMADRAICKGDGQPADMDGLVGAREVSLRIKNLGADDQITVIDIGSRLTASWVQDATRLRSISLKMNEAGTLRVHVAPIKGYEDLNLIYFLGKNGILGTLTIDYSQTSDERFKMIDIDSGDVGSGLGSSSSKAYSIGVGEAPPGYSLVKACMWLTGDRLCNRWSTCSWNAVGNHATVANFTMQGHDEDFRHGLIISAPSGPGWAWSRGHLRATFELKPDPIILK